MKERKKIKYVEKKPPDITQSQQARRTVEEKPQNKPEKNRNYQNTNRKYQYNAQVRQTDRQKPTYNRPKYIYKEPSTGKSDLICIICSEEVLKRQSIWTCECCCISIHLGCMRQWIRKVNGAQGKKQHVFDWKCPQCNQEYTEPLPKYYCYCGKLLNPEYDPDLPAHSCGEICDKKRGPQCPHPCPLQCHSGKCPPCNLDSVISNCQCGKAQKTLKCSEDPQAFVCGRKCEKILNCGKHKCQRNCHTGVCQPCKKKKMTSCFCGNNSDVVDCVEKSYSCGEICGKLLDCGFHKCESKCHQGSCGSCPHTPALQTTCPCGKYSIQMLTGDPDFRTSCQDPIPVCGMPCGKMMECGHKCPNSCHEGPCPPCKVIVDQSCSCGLQTRKVACHLNSHSHFKCQSICKKKKSCGNHICNQVCCPHRASVIPESHPCDLNCHKMLNCGKHECGEPCHLGLCKKCPVVYSQPQPCPCGKTSLRPPVLCGTITPECDNTCDKILECGHKCVNLCHYGPCKCLQKVQIPCRCGKEKIKTTCGRQALCLTKCPLKLTCGHICNLQCHKGTCVQAHRETPCRRPCNKERNNCKHICQQLCHPDQRCQDFPCQAQILIRCECGHRQAMALCGAQEEVKTRKTIVCNKKCENLKRFDTLYKDKQIYYPGSMVQFAFKNYPFLQHLEDRLQKFILRSEENFMEVEFKFPDNYTKLLLTDLFQNHYHLNTHFYRHSAKYAAFTLMQGDHTMIPKPVLTEYVKLISSGKIKQTNLPFEFTIAFEAQQRDKGELILKSLSKYLHKYYSQRNNKYLSLHFWNKEDGQHALSQLESQFQTIQFRCSFNVIPEEQEVNQNEIKEVQDQKQEEIKPDTSQTEKKDNIQQQSKEPKEQIPQIKTKQIPISNDSQVEKAERKKIPKTEGTSKLIVRKNIPSFKKNQYPPSKDNVQDIYLLDQEQLFGEKVNWEEYVKTLCGKKMGPEATEWRIRTLLIISSFHKVPEKIFFQQFDQLIQMYNKDKESAMRILEIQRIDNKSVKSEMEANGIYLSHHQPEMMSYLRLFNYTSVEKIDVQYPEILLNTPEVTRSIDIIQDIQSRNYQSFYQHFINSDFVFGCALIPIVNCLREIAIEDIFKQVRTHVKNLYKYLLFNSQEQLQQFFKQNGFEVGTRVSKSTKQEIYLVKSGELPKQIKQNLNFIKESIKVKRDKKYFLMEPEELYDDQFLTLSTFAFGDFKQSVIQSYINSLVKLLKTQE